MLTQIQQHVRFGLSEVQAATKYFMIAPDDKRIEQLQQLIVNANVCLSSASNLVEKLLVEKRERDRGHD